MKPRNIAAKSLRSGAYRPKSFVDRKRLAKGGYRKHKGASR